MIGVVSDNMQIYTCNYVIINSNLGIKHFILMHVIIL